MLDERRSGRRALICEYCNQSFYKQEHLARHVRSHTREKPFICPVCNKAFSRNDTLLRHARGHRAPGNKRSIRDRTDPANQQNPTSNQDSSSIEPATSEAAPALVALSQTANSSNNTSNQLQMVGNLPWSPVSHLSGDHSARLNSAPSIDGNQMVFDGLGQGANVFQDGSPNNFHTPMWQTSADFDFNDFHSSLFTTSGWQLDDVGWPNLEQTESAIYATKNLSSRRQDIVQRNWFTFLPAKTPDNAMQDAGSDGHNVDETYRARLSQRLLHVIPHEPLPSVNFLNLCIQMFFTHFNPIFPVIHMPTFRPSEKSSLLLLSICSLGSLFLGSPLAAAQGQQIFEQLNKTIMASWETVLSSGRSEALGMTQAGVIGQAFGMLSGIQFKRSKDLLLAQGLHGTVITWARRCGMFQHNQAVNPSINADEELFAQWKAWASAEEKSRATTALYIQDAEYSMLFNTAPLLRHSRSKLPPICAESTWAATTVEEWQASIQSTSSATHVDSNIPPSVDTTQHHPFSIYCELEGITASISEAIELDDLANIVQLHELKLLDFYRRHLSRRPIEETDRFCTEILWHLNFMVLFADINLLEIAAGREGYEQSVQHADRTKIWARSQNARRCAVHGALVLQKAEKMRIGNEPAIHVPRALFYSALVWYCYSEYGEDADDAASRRLDFPEFRLLGIPAQKILFESYGFKHARPSRWESIVATGLHDLLTRMGHWGISRRFAALIIYMVYGDVQGDVKDVINEPEKGG